MSNLKIQNVHDIYQMETVPAWMSIRSILTFPHLNKSSLQLEIVEQYFHVYVEILIDF